MSEDLERKTLGHEGAKMTKDAKHEEREGVAPRQVSSRPSRFVIFVGLRGFALPTPSHLRAPTPLAIHTPSGAEYAESANHPG
jgi:hypothetical protein